MARAPRTQPRKAPTQSRAQETVEAILSATARVLVRDGYERASTNRIAEAAGVSIGSLYQYFPSKEALVSALIERHMTRMLGVLATVGATLPTEVSIAEAARTIISASFAAHRVSPKLHRVLLEQVPRVGTLERIDTFEEQTLGLVEAFLTAHAGELRRENIKLAAKVAVLAVRGITLYSVVRSPDSLADEAFMAEVTDLLVSYLVKPAA
jgi:AcrR family transcriptional regulator